MTKKLVRLTESDLRRIVRESVNKILKEGGYNQFSDGDFAGEGDPYGLNDEDADEDELLNLTGAYRLNGKNVLVRDKGNVTNIVIRAPYSDNKPTYIEGEKAITILDNVKRILRQNRSLDDSDKARVLAKVLFMKGKDDDKKLDYWEDDGGPFRNHTNYSEEELNLMGYY